MFTRCPGCESILPLNAALLARDGGRVHCTLCGRRFDALKSLLDGRPPSADAPHRESPPNAPRGNTGQSAAAAALRPGEADAATGRHDRVWVTILTILALMTLANLAWTFREPLLEVSWIRAALNRTGGPEEEPPAPFRDPRQIRLVSRDFQAHPDRAGLLLLTATFVNRAPAPQDWPDLRLTLFDATGRPLARRDFSPAEYLGRATRPESPLEPDVHVPIRLELVDPGNRATGFELEFL